MCWNFWKKKNKQSAENIQNSTLNQVNGNQTIYNGMPYHDLKELIHDVVESDLMRLGIKARQTAEARTDEYQEAVVDKMGSEELQPMMDKFERPDVQFTLHSSLIQYIKSGEETTKEDMVDMLIDRLKADNNTVEKSVIDEAIVTLPRLSKAAVAFLSILCFRSLTVNGDSFSVIARFSILGNIVEPLKDLTPLDIAYLRQLNCCANIGTLSHFLTYEELLLKMYDYMLRDFGPIDKVDEIFKEYPELPFKVGHKTLFFVDGLSNTLLINLPNKDRMESLLTENGCADKIDVVRNYIETRPVFTTEKVSSLVASHHEGWKYALEVMRRDSVKKLELTPLGMYIAKRNLKKIAYMGTPGLQDLFKDEM